jgi:hypothetical protein
MLEWAYMSGRLKFLLAFLAVGAGLAFWYVVDSSFSTIREDVSASILEQTLTENSCADTDGDGLCDFDETYWGSDFQNADTDGDGFTDGEEVFSGHNPTKAGPDDLLNEKGNLTERTSRLLLGAMMTGDLEPGSANYEQSIDRLVELMFEQVDANTAVELDSIIVASASMTALSQYATTMSRLLKQMLPEIQANERAFLETIRNVPIEELPTIERNNPIVFSAFTSASMNEISAMDSRVAAIKAVRTPPKLMAYQRSLLQYLRGMQQQYRLTRTITKDPVQGLLSLQLLHTLAQETSAELADSFTYQVTQALP